MITLLRANRDLRWLFIAQVISFMGDWFSFVAVTGIVKDATGSEFLVSLAYVSFSLPSFLASPIAGVTVDRFDRRRLLLIVSLLQAVAALGLLTSSGSTVWPLFVFQGVISAFAAFVKPAIDAGVPNLARDSTELRTANALFGSTWGVMLAVGAAVGGVFSEAFGRRTAFVANAVSFVIAMLLIALVRRPMQEAHHADRPAMRPIADMAEAVRYAPGPRGAGADRQQVDVRHRRRHGEPTARAGHLRVRLERRWNRHAAGGTRGGRRPGPVDRAALHTGQPVAGVAHLWSCRGGVQRGYLVAAWSPVIYLAAVVIAIGHLGGGSQWTLSTYGLQLRTPDHIRGRVMAGDFAIVTLVMSITGLGAGVMSELVGVRWTITVLASAAAVAGFVYIAATRPLVQQLATEEAAADATTSV